ncbi:unnamed protein product [Heterobilharzia americana]|nr:unnamed protein product [Heterobilharzia americana]
MKLQRFIRLDYILLDNVYIAFLSHFSMVHKLVQVYNDLGASERCLIHLKKAFQQCSTLSFSSEEVNATILNQQNNTIAPDLICFGGGYDLGYLTSLKVSGCLKLHDYIQNHGGKYLGICAGAYFACDYCSFGIGGPLEVTGERYIKLFQGTASGPVYPGFQYNSENGSYAVPIHATSKDLNPQTTVVYYNGGCTFGSVNWDNSQVLYEYSDSGKPAIIASKLGSGYGILSGVHFEYDPFLLEKQIGNVGYDDDDDDHDGNDHAFIETLKANNLSRLELFQNLINSC